MACTSVESHTNPVDSLVHLPGLTASELLFHGQTGEEYASHMPEMFEMV